MKADRMVTAALGFATDAFTTDRYHPAWALFFHWDVRENRDAQAAAARINAFLWQYGYPPNEVLTPQTESPVEVGVHN